VRIQRGQRTAVFSRYPMPEYDALSLSVIYREGRGGGRERSLDLICRNAVDYEVWLWGLRLYADWARGLAPSALQPAAAEAAAVAAAAAGAGQGDARARLVRLVFSLAG